MTRKTRGFGLSWRPRLRVPSNGPLTTRALIGPIALLEAVTCFLSFV